MHVDNYRGVDNSYEPTRFRDLESMWLLIGLVCAGMPVSMTKGINRRKFVPRRTPRSKIIIFVENNQKRPFYIAVNT